MKYLMSSILVVLVTGCASITPPTPEESVSSIPCERNLSCAPSAEFRVQNANSLKRAKLADQHILCIHDAYKVARSDISDKVTTDEELAKSLSGPIVAKDCDAAFRNELAKLNEVYQQTLIQARQLDEKYTRAREELARINAETPEEAPGVSLRRGVSDILYPPPVVTPPPQK